MNIKFLTLPIACGVMLLPYSMCFGAVRVSNNSAARYGFVNAPVVNNAAVVVNSVNRTTPDTIDTPVDTALENCQAIYPTGEFEIARPTIGNRRMESQQCTAVVELRGYQMGPNGTDLVFARSKLAAGDNFKCNIDSFPEADMNVIAVESVAFPRDNEPTIADVKAAMDREQKQNAGLKIAAAALAGGVGGNLLGKNDVGNDSMFGTDKGKLKTTAIGALGGAALMAGSTYTGKVAGDVILSTGVNATAGAVVGNIAAKNSGDSYLHIEKECQVRDSEKGDLKEATGCLWGKIETGTAYNNTDGKIAYWSPNNDRVLECTDECTKNSTDDPKCSCSYISLIRIRIDETEHKNWRDIPKDGESKTVYTSDMRQTEKDKLKDSCEYRYRDNKIYATGSEVDVFCKIESAQKLGKSIPVLLTGVQDKAFTGYQMSDWNTNKSTWFKSENLYKRDSSGNGYKDNTFTEDAAKLSEELKIYAVANFTPLTIDSDDGGLVDLSNKARLKETAIGAGAGGALGGFVAYQGATDAINERWVSEVRQYKDSLQKFYCQTGNRFLSYYNDVVVIPEPPEITE